jgi:hypothetical protein
LLYLPLDALGGEVYWPLSGRASPGGMDVPLFQDATTDKQRGLRVLWADSLRRQGFKRALELPDRPDLADPHVGWPARPAPGARGPSTRSADRCSCRH